jgi:predicted dehydrogenase
MDQPSTTRKRFATRRGFLKRAAAASTAIALPTIVPATALGLNGAVAPSERITLGGIGIRNRGGYVLSTMLPWPDVQFLAIADVRADRRMAVKETADTRYGNHDCAMYRDFRELLDRADIDAVLIATGDRWHAPASILAAEAGKDIYSEKPCAITIDLAQRLADTIARTGRVFQAGTQRRSISNFIHAIDLARSGKLGKLHTLHASIYQLRDRHDWLPAQPEPDPDVIDWNMWLGPAPWRPFNQAYVDGGWRGFHDFDSGATLLDWGAHTLDLCQAANQADGTLPVEYEPLSKSGDSTILCRYENGVKLVLRRSTFGDSVRWLGLGTCPVRFEGDEAWVETGDSGEMAVSSDSLRAELPAKTIVGTAPTTHVRDFFNCVKTRGKTAANENVMRKSHIACHAAAIAWTLGRKLTFDPVKEVFVGDDEANRLCSRPMREPWIV